MKRFLLGVCLSIFSMNCLAMPTTKKSDFDDEVTVISDMESTSCWQKAICPSFAYIWTEKTPKIAGVYVRIRAKDYYSIDKLSFNIDGKIVNFSRHNLSVPKFETEGYDFISNITQGFIIPLETLRKIHKAKNVKIRVATNNGYFEDTFASMETATFTQASFELGMFLSEIQKIKRH